jgi:hypothetical protein
MTPSPKKSQRIEIVRRAKGYDHPEVPRSFRALTQ